MMKAVSPFIATVLLIALTVSVAGVVGSFVYSMIKTQSEETRETGDKAAKCGSVFLDIDEVKTDSDLNPVNVTLSYSNGNEDLYNFTVYIIDSGNRISSNSTLTPNYTQSNPLSPGRQVVWSIGTTSLSGTLFSVRIVGLCQTDYVISSECKTGQACMKS